MNKHSVSIIIPFFNRWDLTHKILFSLYAHVLPNAETGLSIEVILVDDASTELDCKTGVAWWQKDMSSKFPIKYVRNKENLGFGGSHNRGAMFASGDILVFLSNDVIINGDFVTPIEELIDKYNGEVLIGGRVLYGDTGWNTLMINGKPSIVTYPEGWLIVCTKDMWKRIGGWDMRYGKFDAEDVDLGAWAIYNDVPIIGLNLPCLRHMGGQTIYPLYPDRQKYTIENIKKFADKWTRKFEEKFNA